MNNTMNPNNVTRWCSIVFFCALLTGCASTAPGAASDARDPFERYNRSMFTFNQKLDDIVLKPAATGYDKLLPDIIQTAIGNFFSNIGDVWTAANNFLQGKPRDGSSDLMRVALNSTFGVVGFIDISTPIGLPKHEEDFGQTLAVWGVNSGPYVVLPVFGPSTLRDSVAKPVDLYADPIGYVDTARTRNIARGLRIVDNRAALLGTTFILEGAALDPYQFMKDAYLQRRASRIRDGASVPQ
ncbi:MAG: hypothetical protein RL717_920 [Pseudomonadota bacterium]|jgi:phospholipid-binding lipoprotein MlaA